MNTAAKTILFFLGIGTNPITYEIRDTESALKADWVHVGHDLQTAMYNYGKK